MVRSCPLRTPRLPAAAQVIEDIVHQGHTGKAEPEPAGGECLESIHLAASFRAKDVLARDTHAVERESVRHGAVLTHLLLVRADAEPLRMPGHPEGGDASLRT